MNSKNLGTLGMIYICAKTADVCKCKSALNVENLAVGVAQLEEWSHLTIEDPSSHPVNRLLCKMKKGHVKVAG